MSSVQEGNRKKIKMLDFKLRKPETRGLIHDTRQDAKVLIEAVNLLIEKINELIEAYNTHKTDNHDR